MISSINPKHSVELFHLIFLRNLEQKMEKTLYALKGGCNLRFFHKSVRYSEDMDLDVKTVALETLRKKIGKILVSDSFNATLQTRGIEIQKISEAKQTGTTQRWKLLLRLLGSELPAPTKIEFSRRGWAGDVAYDAVDSEVIRTHELYPVMANHYGKNAAFHQKVAALIGRSETQARDLFDLDLLFRQGADPRSIPKELAAQADIAVKNAESVGFEEFRGQVHAYLAPEYQRHYERPAVWKEMKRSLIQILDGIRP